MPAADFSSIHIANDVIAFDTLIHLYKPLIYLGKSYSNLIQVSPVALDESEKLFLDDLSTYIKQGNESLKDCEIHVLRNQSKKELGFFTEGNKFYPDFIVWILKGDKLYITFIDPKGIRNSHGLSDLKIQFHKVLKERIQPQVENDAVILNSFIISNTSFLEVHWKEQLSMEDFHKNNVYFQKENQGNYIKEMLETK